MAINWGKLFMVAAVIGGGAYLYDINTAKKTLVDATVVKLEATTPACQSNHETMCKYYATVEVPPKMEKKFRIPVAYFHKKILVPNETSLQVMVKQKKIFPPRILELGKEEAAEMAKYPLD